jgi:FAD-linked oxidoreductase
MRSQALRPVWTNWAGNQHCGPTRIVRPASEPDVVEAVSAAARDGLPVKAVGAGHSFTAIACTSGVLVDLRHCRRVLAVDGEAGTVTVEAGITLAELAERLSDLGLAMENLGDINRQSLAGAIATATHGTGRAFRNLSSQVVGLRFVDGQGRLRSCSTTEEPETLAVARVGLGALGIVTAVTLRVVPAFNLHAIEEARRLGEVLAELDELVEATDHFEMYWFPGTDWVTTKRNRRTLEPERPRPRAVAFANDEVLTNALFGAACRVSRRWPPAARVVGAVIPLTGRSEWVERSDKVFTTPRRVHFVEMEYAVEASAFAEAFAGLRRVTERIGAPNAFPVECRWVAPDDIPLSTASGRPSAYLAVHAYRNTPFEQYFAAVEDVMWELGGRPHWGKLHWRRAEDLAPRYPGWGRFQRLRRELDPEGRFSNPYLDRVVGRVEEVPVP